MLFSTFYQLPRKRLVSLSVCSTAHVWTLNFTIIKILWTFLKLSNLWLSDLIRKCSVLMLAVLRRLKGFWHLLTPEGSVSLQFSGHLVQRMEKHLCWC